MSVHRARCSNKLQIQRHEDRTDHTHTQKKQPLSNVTTVLRDQPSLRASRTLQPTKEEEKNSLQRHYPLERRVLS